MVIIRLARGGSKKRPFYSIVVADSRNARDGRFIEQLGYYDPMKDPFLIKLDLDRIDYWLGKGAQLSDTVKSLVNRVKREGNTGAVAEVANG